MKNVLTLSYYNFYLVTAVSYEASLKLNQVYDPALDDPYNPEYVNLKTELERVVGYSFSIILEIINHNNYVLNCVQLFELWDFMALQDYFTLFELGKPELPPDHQAPTSRKTLLASLVWSE